MGNLLDITLNHWRYPNINIAWAWAPGGEEQVATGSPLIRVTAVGQGDV